MTDTRPYAVALPDGTVVRGRGRREPPPPVPLPTFGLCLGRDRPEETLAMPKQQMIIAAASAGLLPLGFIASISNYRDPDAFRVMARRSRAWAENTSGDA